MLLTVVYFLGLLVLAVCACVRACVRACVGGCVRACARKTENFVCAYVKNRIFVRLCTKQRIFVCAYV